VRARCLDVSARTKLIHAFIKGIREKRIYSASRIIVIAENNLGLSASEIYEDVKHMKYANVICVREEKHIEKPGCYTTNAIKVQAEEKSRQLIEQGRVYIAENYISANPFKINRTETEQETKQAIQKQLKQLRRIVKNSETATSAKPTIVITGKCDSMGRFCGEQDDLAIVFILCIYWMDMWFLSPKLFGGSVISSGIPAVNNASHLRKRKAI
jgi:hypothetical protein